MAEQIELSKAFIEQELPKAPPFYVSVYLMTLAFGENTAEIAKKLNTTETEVLYAWGYWKGRGYLQQTQEVVLPRKTVIAATPPEYSVEELAQIRKHPDMMHLFQFAQEKLGKMLGYHDMRTLFSFHDWLGFPTEVIERLLSYCVENGHYGMRYIETVAIGWADEGVNTLEKAEEYIGLRKKDFRAVMKAFGQSARLPVKSEEEYIKKWLREYGFSIEVITCACDKTVSTIGEVSFPYADKILQRWKEAGVKTQTDIAALDQAFAAKRNQTAEEKALPQGKKQNRFINYTQSEWDFNELERLEREQREKW